ncbi:MAG: serine/threonine protein kinase [Bacteroidales bacterium]|nr:serine/threonine protein kinase [Bacteroidales bacterium]
MIGEKIHHYRITRLIGEGGMASVYEALHEKLQSKVAIKVLNPILTANANIRQRFENEARFMAGLNHANITRVIDYEERPDLLAIVMEFLEGEDLNVIIKKHGPMPLTEAIPIFLQALDAFEYAHQKGIVHRDVKPSNIFIKSSGTAKILDFGIAKIVGGADDMTVTGTQMGTPVYMSPEQVNTDKNIDHRSDIYSLAVTLYYMLNGKPPYDVTTTSSFQIYTRIVHEPLPLLGRFPEIDEILKTATHKDRTLRYQTCRDFKLALIEATQTPNSALDKQITLPAIDDDKTMIDDGSDTYSSKQGKNEVKGKHVAQKKDPVKVEGNNTINKPQKTNKTIFVLAVLLGLLALIIILWRTVGPFESHTADLARQDSIRVADSLNKVRDEIRNRRIADSLGVQDSIQSIINDSVNRIRDIYLGDHLFSCYFIGSDEQFGKVTIQEANGVFNLNGRHEHQGNSVKIEGTIKVLSLRKFEFTGTITSNNKSESNASCTWNGTTVFWASGSRRYWRTQDHNCFSHTGDMDIYFNRSGT